MYFFKAVIFDYHCFSFSLLAMAARMLRTMFATAPLATHSLSFLE